MSTPLRQMPIKASGARRLQSGGLWVYANEVATDLSQIEDGELVELRDPHGRSLGVACAEPHSLIAARRFSAEAVPIDFEFFLARLRAARAYRSGVVAESSCREVFSESDLLPGLIVDRYDRVLVIQLMTSGMERYKETIVESLCALYEPAAIVVRNETELRRQQGLPTTDEERLFAAGTDLSAYEITFAGLKLFLDFRGVQKTGLFLDQAPAYRMVSDLNFGGRRGADLYCYSGIFGMIALSRSARHVAFVDSSRPALEMLERNLSANGFESDRYTIARSDVGEYLEHSEPRSNDFLFVDPPKFIKSRKDYYQGLQGYFSLNLKAASALADGGLLFTWSCSHHAGEEVFRERVIDAILKTGRTAYEIARFRQGADHPVHLAMQESFYLKGFLFRLSPR